MKSDFGIFLGRNVPFAKTIIWNNMENILKEYLNALFFVEEWAILFCMQVK